MLVRSCQAYNQHWLAPPAPRPKFYSAQDAVHLEDESGRVRLVGERIRREREREGGGLVTGKINDPSSP
jgi:DNA polymerase delta subunit 2